MYNGIGLQTPRGSGTNGHVQRNWAIIRKTKDKCEYKADERLDQLNKPPNQEILDHVRKRKVEVKCAEFADILEDQGSTSDEIKTKVAAYRELLMENDTYSPIPTDEFGRTNGTRDPLCEITGKSSALFFSTVREQNGVTTTHYGYVDILNRERDRTKHLHSKNVVHESQNYRRYNVMLRKQRDKIANRNLQMMMARATRGRGPIDGRAFFERLWQGNIFLDRQKVFRRSRKRKLHTVNSKKRIQETQSNQHCCCCQRIQLHLLASRQSSLRSVIR
ncbi:hypothetical protein PV326_001214 [Microctonus aethiopoides]|nr:hypothetical protein PV326_001214 [Microctonus aethiopoides]